MPAAQPEVYAMTHEVKTYLDGRITLHHGDALEIMPTLPRADVLVSDPPYGIGYQHSGGGRGRLTDGLGNVLVERHVKSDTMPITGDDQPFDPRPMLGMAPRVLLWGADHFRALLPPAGRYLCWDKSVGVGPHDTFTDAEFAWTNLVAFKRNVYRHLWKGFAKAKCWHDTCGGGRMPRAFT